MQQSQAVTESQPNTQRNKIDSNLNSENRKIPEKVPKLPKKVTFVDVLKSLSKNNLLNIFSFLALPEASHIVRLNKRIREKFEKYIWRAQFLRIYNLVHIPLGVKEKNVYHVMKREFIRNKFIRNLNKGKVPKFPDQYMAISPDQKFVRALLSSILDMKDYEIVIEMKKIHVSTIYLSYVEEKKSIFVWCMYPDKNHHIIAELKLKLDDLPRLAIIRDETIIIETAFTYDDKNQNFYILNLPSLFDLGNDKIVSLRDISKMSFIVDKKDDAKLSTGFKKGELEKNFAFSKVTDKDLFLLSNISNLNINSIAILQKVNVIAFLDKFLSIIILVDLKNRDVLKWVLMPFPAPIISAEPISKTDCDSLILASIQEFFKIKVHHSSSDDKLSVSIKNFKTKDAFATNLQILPLDSRGKEEFENLVIISDPNRWILLSTERGILLNQELRNNIGLKLIQVKQDDTNILLLGESKELKGPSRVEVYRISFEDLIKKEPNYLLAQLYYADKNLLYHTKYYQVVNDKCLIMATFDTTSLDVYDLDVRMYTFLGEDKVEESKLHHTINLKSKLHHKKLGTEMNYKDGKLLLVSQSSEFLTNRFSLILDFYLGFEMIMFSNFGMIKSIV